MKIFTLSILMILYGSSLNAAEINKSLNANNNAQTLLKNTNPEKVNIGRTNTNSDAFKFNPAGQQKLPTKKCRLVRLKSKGHTLLCI